MQWKRTLKVSHMFSSSSDVPYRCFFYSIQKDILLGVQAAVTLVPFLRVRYKLSLQSPPPKHMLKSCLGGKNLNANALKGSFLSPSWEGLVKSEVLWSKDLQKEVHMNATKKKKKD